MPAPVPVVDVSLRLDPEDGRWFLQPEPATLIPEPGGPASTPWARTFARPAQRLSFLQLGEPLVKSPTTLARLASEGVPEASVFLLTCCDCTDPGCGGVYAHVLPGPAQPDGRLRLDVRSAGEALSGAGPASELQVNLRVTETGPGQEDVPEAWTDSPLEQAALLANWTHDALDEKHRMPEPGKPPPPWQPGLAAPDGGRLHDAPDQPGRVLHVTREGTRVLSILQAAALLRQDRPAHPRP